MTPMQSRDDSTHYVWYVIVLLSVVNVFNYMDRMALAMLAPYIKKDLSLSDGQLGLLIGFAFSVFYAICGIPIARWADRGVRRTILAISLATWSVMTALTGAAQNFWHVFAARVGVGAGEAGCLPPAQSMICDYVPLEKRSGVFAVHSFGLYAGTMAGMMLSGWMAETMGWRLAFVALGLPGLVLALVVRLTLREPPRGRFDAKTARKTDTSFHGAIATLWRCKTYKLIVLYLVLGGFTQFAVTQWWPSFYTRVWGLSLSTVGVYLGFGSGMGSAIGLLTGGLLANRAARRDVTRPLVVGGVAVLLALPVAVGALFVPSPWTSMLFASLLAALIGVTSGPAVASLYSVTTSSTRATAGAISILCSSVLGYGLGPLCVGVLSDLLTPAFGAEALRYAILAPACLYPIAAFVLYRAARQLPIDLKAQGS